MKKKIRFIVNPFSGTSGKKSVPDLLKEHLDHTAFEYEIVYTEFAGHAIQLAKDAVSLNFDFIASVGGDGSVNEVAQSILNSKTTLIVLPGGSGNGFAMHLGLGRDIKKAIQYINTGVIMEVDTCNVNNRFFANVSGLGFDARIAYKTKKNSKRGFLPYFMTSIKEAWKFKHQKLQITIDDTTIEGEYAAAVIANASMYGYYFTISPKASLQDGVMDIMLIKKAPLYRYFFMVFRFLNRSLHKSKITQTYQGKTIFIQMDKPNYIHVDGEGYKAEKELQFNIAPSSLKVLVPRDNSIDWTL
ncbi:MAG: diacylglycerol kinase family lipid kinase [Saprospiraceae bacterium]|nr:diacylglycerol kinase family lipid kinase [Saprospiraceae bacterium]